ARAFTMRAGGQIITAAGSAAGSHVVVHTTGGDIDLEAAGRPRAHIDVSADTTGGTIELMATGGDVDVAGDLLARGTTVSGVGGAITLGGDGRVSVSGEITANGRQDGTGGSFTIDTTGVVVLNGSAVDVTGGNTGGTGTIMLHAGPSLSTTATLNANGTGPASTGGTVKIDVTGNVTIQAPIFAQGTGSLTEGGSGGAVMVTAGRPPRRKAGVTAPASTPFGDGGTVGLIAGVALQQSEPIFADGGDGLGGEVDLTAGQQLTLGAAIDVHGGDSGVGGDVDARAGTLV